MKLTTEIETDEVEVYSPIKWDKGRGYEGQMKADVEKWLRDNPISPDDSPATAITRTIFARLQGNLVHSLLEAYPTAIAYETIEGEIIRDLHLTIGEVDEYLKVLGDVWVELANEFAVLYTKPAPADD